MRRSKSAECQDGQCAPVTGNANALQALNISVPGTQEAVDAIDKALAAKTKARNEEFATCKPSRMLEMAMEDLEKVQADPKYRVNMGVWHEPRDQECVVCLAGSVMAKSLNIPDNKSVGCYGAAGLVEKRKKKSEALALRLDALNDLRTGYISGALSNLRIARPAELPGYVRVASYESGKGKTYESFTKSMQGIIDLLRKHDL